MKESDFLDEIERILGRCLTVDEWEEARTEYAGISAKPRSSNVYTYRAAMMAQHFEKP